MIDHISLRVNDFDKALNFFKAALKPLGYDVLMQFPGAVGLGAEGKADFWLSKSEHAPHPTHIAFSADRKAVTAFHAAALAAGGTDNGAPGVRADYHPNYYAAFVRDHEGNNVEVVCHDAEGAAGKSAKKSSKAAKGKKAAPKGTKGKNASAAKKAVKGKKAAPKGKKAAAKKAVKGKKAAAPKGKKAAAPKGTKGKNASAAKKAVKGKKAAAPKGKKASAAKPAKKAAPKAKAAKGVKGQKAAAKKPAKAKK